MITTIYFVKKPIESKATSLVVTYSFSYRLELNKRILYILVYTQIMFQIETKHSFSVKFQISIIKIYFFGHMYCCRYISKNEISNN